MPPGGGPDDGNESWLFEDPAGDGTLNPLLLAGFFFVEASTCETNKTNIKKRKHVTKIPTSKNVAKINRSQGTPHQLKHEKAHPS